MKKFIYQLFFTIALPVLIFVITWVYLVRNSTWNNFGILNFQVSKLVQNKDKHFNVVFIGDSSGGNAINTEGLNAINLCLTGSYGFEGNEAFLDIIDDHITYDTLVVINNLGIFSRTNTPMAKWVPNIHSENVFKLLPAIKKSLSFSKPILINYKKYGFNYKSKTTRDYFLSEVKTDKKVNVVSEKLKKEKIIEFKKFTHRLSKNPKVKTFFFLGPTLPYNEQYYQNILTFLRINKISHQPSRPFLLNEQSKGSSEHHISRAYSKQSTQYYLNLIRK